MKFYLLLCSFAVFVLNASAQDAYALKNESELGLTDATGNTQSKTFYGKHLSVYANTKNIYTLKGNYYYGEAAEIISMRNWMASLRYDRILSERFNIFAAETYEGNKFMGFETRSGTDLGARYYIFTKENQDDLDYWFGEFGYRLTHEDRLVDDGTNSISHQSRLYTEYSKKFSSSFYGKFYAEWLKTIGNDNRNIVVSEISGNSRMSETLTLKVAYLMRYDDTLQERGFEHSNDRILTVAVIATY